MIIVNSAFGSKIRQVVVVTALIASALLSAAPADAQDLEGAKIIEIVNFNLKDGVTYEEFSALDQAVEEQHVSKQPGFVARQSAKGENGAWLVVVYWE